MAIGFRVQHRDHSGALIAALNPVGSSLRYGFKVNDMGDITCDFARSDPLLTRDMFAPKRTDWRLQISTDDAPGWQNIGGGICGPWEIENDTGVVKFQGYDWCLWLEQPYYHPLYEVDGHFLAGGGGGLDDVLQDPTAVASIWTTPDTQQDVIEDLLDNLDYGGSGVTITPNFAFGAGWSQVLIYNIPFQDETTILDHIKRIGSLDDPLGFDFYMDWNKTMRFFNPRLTDPSSVTPVWSLIGPNALDEGNIVRASMQNNGPQATYTVATGIGSPGYWEISTFAGSVSTYRKWVRLARVGESYLTPEQVVSKGNLIGYLDRFPKKDCKVTIKPDMMSPTNSSEGFFNNIGRAVDVDYDFKPFHRIDGFWWITAQEFYQSSPGNWLCDLSLQKIEQ